jgi:D-glycero-alpha-D-manno-heptose-7-phosphate kinase
MDDQILEPVKNVRSRAPVRIDFAGGWSDVPIFAEQEGGRVVNAAISLYAHVDCRLGGKRIRLVARDLETTVIIPDPTAIFYNGELDLHKAALNMLPVSGGVEVTTRSDVPAGSGLGGSGSLDVALLAALATAREDLTYDAEDFAEMGFLLETSELKLLGGRQDQYGAAFGGFNEFVFGDGPVERIPIEMDTEASDELRAHLTIVYTGESHFSSDTHDAVWTAYREGDESMVGALRGMREAALVAAEALRKSDWRGLAEAVDENWSCQLQLASEISTDRIKAIETRVRTAGAWGLKATGAGAGGCMLIVAPPECQADIHQTVSAAGGDVLNWGFDFEGVRLWSS